MNAPHHLPPRTMPRRKQPQWRPASTACPPWWWATKPSCSRTDPPTVSHINCPVHYMFPLFFLFFPSSSFPSFLLSFLLFFLSYFLSFSPFHPSTSLSNDSSFSRNRQRLRPRWRHPWPVPAAAAVRRRVWGTGLRRRVRRPGRRVLLNIWYETIFVKNGSNADLSQIKLSIPGAQCNASDRIG